MYFKILHLSTTYTQGPRNSFTKFQEFSKVIFFNNFVKLKRVKIPTSPWKNSFFCFSFHATAFFPLVKGRPCFGKWQILKRFSRALSSVQTLKIGRAEIWKKRKEWNSRFLGASARSASWNLNTSSCSETFLNNT